MPAIPYIHTNTTAEPWDASVARDNLKEGEDASYYREEFAWIDDGADPALKGSYRFPHHMVSEDGKVGAANLKACESAIGILNGGMGGSQVPASEHQAVYEHLAHHMRDAQMIPADLKHSAETPDTQYRTVTTKKLTFRAASAGQPATVSGYAAVFNSLSQPIWQYGGSCEMIAPGAFTSLSSDDVRLLMNHDASLILARNTSGTLTLKQDDNGLHFEAQLPNTSYANDLAESMRRGDIDGCSFAFQIVDSDTTTVNGEQVVVIRSATVSDVSIVTYPAYTAASASIRSKTELVFTDSINTSADTGVLAPTYVNVALESRKRELELLQLEG